MPREPVYGESQAVMDAAMRGELRARLISDRLQMTATEARWRHNLWLVQKSKELGAFYDRMLSSSAGAGEQLMPRELIPDRLQIQDITPPGYPGCVTKFSWPAYVIWMTYAKRVQQVIHERETERVNLEEVISCATWNRLRRKWSCKHPGGAWPVDSVQDEEC